MDVDRFGDAALPAAPRVHDLRHCHASWLLAAGVAMHVVSRRLCHQSIRTTDSVYSHIVPGAQAAATAAIEAALVIETAPASERRLRQDMAG